MAPTYKLHYFNARGAAEPIRFIFKHAGVKYEDIRCSFENWPSYKPETPYGQLPVLEVDGKKLAQSNAIGRYLAKKYNLVGKDDFEAFQCDSIVDGVADLRTAVWKFGMETDATKKAEEEKSLKSEKIPLYLSKFETILTQNKGFTVGNNITWSDMVVTVLTETLEQSMGEKLEKYPAIKALREKVYSLPGIAEWVKKRPETDF